MDKENCGLVGNSVCHEAVLAATTTLSPHTAAESPLDEHQSITSQPNRKIDVNRFTDLNMSANKACHATNPFKSVDVLDRKRRELNLSRTHEEMQLHLT